MQIYRLDLSIHIGSSSSYKKQQIILKLIQNASEGIGIGTDEAVQSKQQQPPKQAERYINDAQTPKAQGKYSICTVRCVNNDMHGPTGPYMLTNGVQYHRCKRP
jgi:hypothetical protein